MLRNKLGSLAPDASWRFWVGGHRRSGRLTTGSAEARRYVHHRHSAHHSSDDDDSGGGSYSPQFSSIIVDGNSGAVLNSASPDGLRHPASLTKIMTLYLLFERLDSGKIKLDTEMPVSAHAADQDPTKLGLRPGQTLRVEDAIKGMVTRSANDAAVVIAGEFLGGNEDDFAKIMTRKAHALGMSRTVYRNASGLPNDEQVTTARDQSTLGRAIQDRFPRYYRYFSTTAFNFHGHTITSHNHLLGSVEGVDGIKTGYTRASGFNLVTSIRRGNRHPGRRRDGRPQRRFARRHHAQPAGGKPRQGARPRAPLPRSPSATGRQPMSTSPMPMPDAPPPQTAQVQGAASPARRRADGACAAARCRLPR